MAVTSIWRVKGWLGKVVIYIENPEKTTNPKFYKSDAITDHQCQGLEDVISYAINSDKTQEITEDIDVMERYVSGIHCNPSTARKQMMDVKYRFGKTDGTIAYHGYQSFAPGEATPEIAHEIGKKLAERLWGERYQVVVATHLDKSNHLHNHFVLNTVSLIDGIKYHRTKKDYHDMQRISDELCREYGLSVIEDPQPGKSKQYGEWRAEQEQRPTWRGIVRSDVDDALRQSMTERQFFENLHRKGYEVKVGKDISVRPPGKPRFVRLARNFGDDYTLEGIRRRILEQSRAARPLPEPAPKRKQYRVSGNWKDRKKVTGFRALYFHYCYLLGVFKRKKPQNNRKIHFLLKEDLIKMDKLTDEARLLGRNRIDTEQQLSSYKDDLEVRLNELIPERRKLYRKQNEEGVKEEISDINKEIAVIRKEMNLCDDIAVRSGIMREKLKKIREDQTKENEQRKEKSRYDKLR